MIDGESLKAYWTLQPGLTFLNHGTFGACPRAVLQAQTELRNRMEANPVRFFESELPALLDRAREQLADFIGASRAEDLAFLPNVTSGVNTVLRSLFFEPNDELLITNHRYKAVDTAVDFVAQRSGAIKRVVDVPFPIHGPEAVIEAVLGAVNSRTRLVIIDHVTSPTGLVFPIERLVAELSERGVDTLVDGAHGVGMLPLQLEKLGAAYYSGNCHKWLCAPKGSAFLWVRRDRQEGLRPLSISGAKSPFYSPNRFRLEFGWTGTIDPSPYLCVPTAIRTLEELVDGGWPALRAHNHALALNARSLLCDALGNSPAAPDSMIGSLATVVLPDSERPAQSPTEVDALEASLSAGYGIDVPVFDFSNKQRRLLRVSAQIYNTEEEYERLVAALRVLLPAKESKRNRS
jgi:isopenicillin-N epimerase